MTFKQWKYAGIVVAIQLMLTASAVADPCVAYSEKDFTDFLAKAKTDASQCLDQNTKLQTISLSITTEEPDKNSYLRWHLKAPVVIDVPNIVITSDNRQTIVADFPAQQTSMFDIKASGVTLNWLTFLNNSTTINANNSNLAMAVILVENGSDSVHIKDVRIVSNASKIPQDAGIYLAGNNAVVSNCTIKANGNGVIILGNNDSVLNNKIETKGATNTVAIGVAGQAPIVKGNSIYGVQAFGFISVPALTRSDAANIIRANPSLYYDATGEDDEDFAGDDNFKEVYGIDGYTGDLTYCPPPNGDPYYKPGQDYLTCNPPADQKTIMCTKGPVVCPPGTSPDATNTVCIKTVTVENPNVNGANAPKDLGPLVPQVNSQGSGGCSLVRD